MAPSLVALALFAITLVALPAEAYPVRIGRYAEIPYGIRPDHPHPTARGGPRRTGRLSGVAPAAQPRQLFERTLRHRFPRGPTIAADGTLYVGTSDGLTALGPDGEERWSVSLGRVYEPPSLSPSDEPVVVTRGGLVAIVSREGVVRYTADLGAPARGSPLILDDGSVLVSTIDRRVHRLDANLRRVFAIEQPDGTGMTLSLTTSGAIAVPGARSLALVDPAGRLVRDVILPDRASAPAAVADDGTLWVPTAEGTLLAIDPSGRVRSRTPLGSRHHDGAAPAIGRDGAVRVPTITEGIVCVGPGGTERWRLPNPGGFRAAASIDRDDTLLVSDAGDLLAVGADGTERWRVPVGEPVMQEPVLGADGTLYLVTERGRLLAWRAP